MIELTDNQGVSQLIPSDCGFITINALALYAYSEHNFHETIIFWGLY